MPILLGFILGVVVTIAGAYEYDANTGRVANGLPVNASAQAPLVNWDIVTNDWQHLQTQMRLQADNIEQAIKRHTS